MRMRPMGPPLAAWALDRVVKPTATAEQNESVHVPRDTPVSEIMTTELVSVSPDTPIGDAANTMAEAGVGALPVLDSGGHLLGVLEDEHIIVEDARLPEPTYVQLFGAYLRVPGSFKRFEEEFKKSAAANVSDAMDDDPHTVPPDATVEDIATDVIEKGLDRVFVIDEDLKPIGIVTRIDIVRAISRSGP